MESNKFYWSLNKNNINVEKCCDTVNECIVLAREEAEELKNKNKKDYYKVYISKVEDFEPKVCIDSLLSNLNRQYYSLFEEMSEDLSREYSNEELAKLSLYVNSAFSKWSKEMGLEYDNRKVVNTEEYILF